MAFIIEAAGSTLWAPLASWATCGVPRRPDRFLWSWQASAGFVAVSLACLGWWPEAIGYGASFLVATVIRWWRRRKDRRRVIAALGAKARARIAAMVSAMRERWQPRPAAQVPA